MDLNSQSDDRDSSRQSVQVWADVGGTFTDCFVTANGITQHTKVLSNGMVRGSIVDIISPTQLQLEIGQQRFVDSFWSGAELAVLASDGRAFSLGRVIGWDAQQLLVDLDSDLPPHVRRGNVAQLNAGLEAPVLGTRILLQLPLGQPFPSLEVRLGTTRGTNALLTRRGADTALITTRGFGDLLEIGYQNRPDLFALNIVKPAPLTRRVLEVDQRMDAAGNEIQPLDEVRLRKDLRELIGCGVQSLAVCLMHGHVNDDHERRIDQIAREIGFDQISLSSEVMPLIKLVARAETTTLDAYLNPILSGYVQTVWQQWGGPDHCRLQLMTSGGNLVSPAAFRGRDSILSGPAGGVVALGHVAKSCGVPAAIGLDMGGTSTDVCRFDGKVGRRYESLVSGVRVLTPMMDIHTVAAGGGSICAFRNGRLHVGPESAGADPGPACYGRGGPLTITDVNLLLGRIPVDRFPFPLDPSAATERLQQIYKQTQSSGLSFADWETLAGGFLQIAITHVAEAVRAVSTAQGTDPRQMALVGFGGAAGQLICQIADALQVRRVLDHPHGSMLSALGMGLAPIGRVVSQGVYQGLTPNLIPQIETWIKELQNEATRQLREEQRDHSQPMEFQCEAEVRYAGTDASLSIALFPMETIAERFEQKHQQTFGYTQAGRPNELVSLRCEATIRRAASPHSWQPSESDIAQPSTNGSWWTPEGWQAVPVLSRSQLIAGQTLTGPLMIVSNDSTLCIESHWQGMVQPDGVIDLAPKSQFNASLVSAAEANDPILLEIISRRMQGIADAMGDVLRRTAISVNVKERRDYSCAVFRGDGSLVANAPHVPVHLGAMGHTVRRMLSVFPDMSAGDCYLSNDPYNGGSHLPDVTAISPVFCDRGRTGRPDFLVASRAHHAEIGGRTPGSMPPDATSLAEEGVLIRDFAWQRNGIVNRQGLAELLVSGDYPSRSVDENLADIAAQAAAGVHGVTALRELANQYSAESLDQWMQRLLELASQSIGNWIQTLDERSYRFKDTLDDRTPIAVAMQKQGDRLSIDFQGTSDVHPGGFNATPSIVTAAVLYVLRLVAGKDLPLCDGVLEKIDLRIPPGLLDPPPHQDPARCAAVVAGNVETSQRIVDVLLGALQLSAASQGTMNNLLIGDATFGYYETIGGGAGATAQADGADAVHTHMTNTLITDPEVMESRLPLRLWQFSVRRGSGGAGQHVGGNGLIREIEFLRPLQVSLITGRRATQPYGAAGGQPGQSGENILIRAGQPETLPPAVTTTVSPGDRLMIRTPGGGGWGETIGEEG